MYATEVCNRKPCLFSMFSNHQYQPSFMQAGRIYAKLREASPESWTRMKILSTTHYFLAILRFVEIYALFWKTLNMKNAFRGKKQCLIKYINV